MVVKAYVLNTHKGTFCSFSQKIPAKGIKARIAKEKVRKAWIEAGHQPYSLPLIFVSPNILKSISEKLKRKPIELEINVSELLNFNSLKEHLIKQFIS